MSRYGFVDATPRGTLFAMAQGYGVPLWDEGADPPRPLFDTPQVVEVVRRYVGLARLYQVMPEPEIGSNLLTSGLINDGRAAIWTDMAFARDVHAARTNLGLAPFPEGTAAANPGHLYGFFVSAGTAHPEAAWRWLSYLSANYQPPLPGMFPGRRSVGESLSWWRRLDGDTRAVYECALDHPAADDPPDRPLWGAVAAVFRDGVPVEQALATAQAQALDVQIELAGATPAVPQPVASAQPIPAAGQTVIRFAPPPAVVEEPYRALATAFQEQHPGTRIEIVPYPLLTLDLPTETDCFAGSTRFARATWGMQPALLDLDPLLDADPDLDLAGFHPQFLAPVQEGGALWALPYEADALLVYLNLDLLGKAGLSLPAPDRTMDDFLSTATDLAGDGHYGFTTREGAYGDLVFVLERLGARLVDDAHDPPLPTFDDPTVVEALEQYAGLARQKSLTPATPSTQSGWPDASVLGGHPPGVANGDVAMWIDYLTYHAVSPPLPFEAGVAPLPAGIRASTEFDVSAFYISAHASAPQACWDWITYLSEQPQVVTALPARRSLAASPDWQAQVGEAALPAYQATLAHDDTSIFRQRWEVPWLPYTYPWLDAAFQATVAGQDAQAALTTTQAQAENLIACVEAGSDFTDWQRLRECARQIDPNYP